MIDDPWTFDIVGFTFSADPAGALNGTLELRLAKAGSAITLRFEHAHEIEIDAGFPHSYMGLEILDVSSFDWEHSMVRVQGFEPAPGIRFWAKAVTRIEA